MHDHFLYKDRISDLTRRVIETYVTSGRLQHLDHCPLPNYDIVVQLLDDLKEILYPGYRHRDWLHMGNVVYHVGDIIDRLHDRLAVQFERALCHGRGMNTGCTPEKKYAMEQLGAEKAILFLGLIPDIRRSLAFDVEAAYAGDPACKSFDEVVFCYPGLEAITVYRLAHAMNDLGIPLIPRMMSEYAHGKTGIDIHPGATIGSHFFIDHGTGVVIGETCVIGDWVKIYQGVTLGALSFPKDEKGELVRDTKRHPTIEDNVVIYANATILGGETHIGRGSVIGSSVWITKSVAPGTTVLMEPPALKLRSPNS